MSHRWWDEEGTFGSTYKVLPANTDTVLMGHGIGFEHGSSLRPDHSLVIQILTGLEVMVLDQE